jgi:hypothetical protein
MQKSEIHNFSDNTEADGQALTFDSDLAILLIVETLDSLIPEIFSTVSGS